MTRAPWLLVWGWGAAILVGTSIPGRQLPPAFPYADKLMHLLLYGVLGWLVARALRSRGAARPTRRRSAGALLAIALFAAADEWHQDLVPGRSSDPVDWMADVLGATAGFALLTTTLRSEQRT